MKGNFKDLRKAAFAITFGTVMGKFTAELLEALISSVIVATCEKAGTRLENAEHKMQQKTDSQ